jgi:hypothetical protein
MLRPCRRLPNQCLTKSPPYLTFLTVIEVKISLILGNLLISGVFFQNPAYRLARHNAFVSLNFTSIRLASMTASIPPEVDANGTNQYHRQVKTLTNLQEHTSLTTRMIRVTRIVRAAQ